MKTSSKTSEDPAVMTDFTLFTELPTDIRYMIWKLTLPGPRTICPGDPRTPRPGDIEDQRRYVSELQQLVFPKDHHTPNPIALSVCRESREIALEKYRLCFGTPNVYMDLSKDIFYFGPWYTLDLAAFWNWNFRSAFEWEFESLPHTFNAAVKADLELVQRVGIKYNEGWQEYDDFIDSSDSLRTRGGCGLRRDLRGFKSLREVLLSDGSYTETFRPGDPGRTVITDFDVKLEEPDWDNISDDENYDDFDEQLRQRAERVMSDFRTKNVTAEEAEQGIPELKLVTFERISGIPWDTIVVNITQRFRL